MTDDEAKKFTLWGRAKRIGLAAGHLLGEIDQATGAQGIRDDAKKLGRWVRSKFDGRADEGKYPGYESPDRVAPNGDVQLGDWPPNEPSPEQDV